jgi:RHS repeat-associated protein
MTGYVYDAEGNRVAKGTISSWSCDPSANGLTAAANETDYVLGPGGEQVTELAQDANGSMNWQRTYVYAGGALIATYDPVPNPAFNPAQYNPANPTVDPPNLPLPSFRLTDWLGTMRATTDAAGVWQGGCTGLPFGDGQACNGNIPDPHHFTGKERDSESGNDYFGARYYASAMGRFLSSDPLMASAKAWDPQTWNRYTYGRNNPLKMIDPTGMAEVTAAQCANDKGCVTVNVNVIYDKNSNNGNGLTDKQKTTFEKGQLQNAKNQYGNADIHLNVSYTAGSVSYGDKGLTITGGLEKGALNVVVTDQVGTATSGIKGGYAVSFINANSTDHEDLPVEMAHQFYGDTRGVLNSIMGHDSSGISKALFDAYAVTAEDVDRAVMNHSSNPNATDFNKGARLFQQAITPTTTPRTK